MSQLIYILLALVLVIVLSLNLQRGVDRTAREQTLNEVQTQLVGVGTEVLERIGRTHFDEYTLINQNAKPSCGRVENGKEAVHFHDPGSNTCGSYDTCTYIEGFHGLDPFTLTRGEFEFAVTIDSVGYVNPADFDVSSGSPTFAKRVWITIENPFMYLGDDPTNTFALKMDRTFTYGCVTDPNFIPFLRPSDPACPSNPCSVRY